MDLDGKTKSLRTRSNQEDGKTEKTGKSQCLRKGEKTEKIAMETIQ